MAYKVVCVEIDSKCGYRDCRKIKLIGILTDSRGVNKYTPEKIYEWIKDGDKFFIENNGERTFLIKAEREGTKYVRTLPNDTEEDNLLELGSC